MTNFSPKLQDSTQDQLLQLINQSSPHYGSLASDELTRRALIELQGTIKIFNEQSSKQTEKMIWLTWLIAGLTGVLVVGLLIQIYLAKIQVAPILSDQQRNERRAYEFCKEPGNASIGWPDATGGQISCSEVLKMAGDKYK